MSAGRNFAGCWPAGHLPVRSCLPWHGRLAETVPTRQRACSHPSRRTDQRTPRYDLHDLRPVQRRAPPGRARPTTAQALRSGSQHPVPEGGDHYLFRFRARHGGSPNGRGRHWCPCHQGNGATRDAGACQPAGTGRARRAGGRRGGRNRPARQDGAGHRAADSAARTHLTNPATREAASPGCRASQRWTILAAVQPLSARSALPVPPDGRCALPLP